MTCMQEVVAHAECFQNECLIFCHVSRKYKNAEVVLEKIKDALPPHLLAKTGVTLRAFGR